MNTKKISKSKTILLAVILILTTVLLPMLQSCEKENVINPEIESGEKDYIINHGTESGDDNENFEDNAINLDNITPVKKTNSSPEKMQKQTNKLVIYIHPFIEDILTPALNIFKSKYPDVEVDLREWGAGALQIVGGVAFADSTPLLEYYQILRTELMAGKGPDLIVGDPGDINNIYKMMDSGVFADLNPFIENDRDFNLDDYNKAVLNAGIYKGKRYIMPLDYEAPVILTTKEILDAEKIKLSDLSTFDGFINVINKYNEKYKDNPKKSVFEKSLSTGDLINFTFPWCGIDIVDWENGKTGIDDPRFKIIMDAMKWAYVPEKDEVYEHFGGTEITADALQNQDWLFDSTTAGSPLIYNSVAGLLRYRKLTPVFFTYPNIDNKTTAKVQTIAAIPKASQNQVNAYNLLKIILSEDIQSNNICFTFTPVLKKSARKIFEAHYNISAESSKNNFLYYWKESSNPKEEMDKYINMLTNIDSCKLTDNEAYNNFFLKDMRPYYEGKQSFEQFAKKLKNDLELYISE